METETSAKLASIYFHFLLPSQSEVQREEIEKHQLMLEKGNIHLPLRPTPTESRKEEEERVRTAL